MMLRNHLLKAVLTTALILISAAVASASVPIVLSHQGYLLGSSDVPVDGMVNITYGIYDVPTGGFPLWTEAHPGVTVAKGLFSSTLGSIVPLSSDVLSSPPGLPGSSTARYLEVVVNGTPIVPRTQMVASPYAVASSRVSGDIETAPGSLTLNDGSHDRAKIAALGSVTYVGTWDVSTNNENRLYCDTDSAGLAIRIEDRNLIGLRVNKGINETLPYATLHVSSINGAGRSSLECYDDSVVEQQSAGAAGFNKAELIEAIAAGGIHSTKSLQVGPGVVHEIKEDCDDGDARIGLNVSTTGGWSGGASMSSTRNVSSDVDCSVDANGSGHAEHNMRVRINQLESRLSLASDIDDDGQPDLDIKAETGQDDALISFTAVGSGDNKKEANIGAVLNGNVVIGCAAHTDNSGTPENRCEMSCDDSTASSTMSSERGKYYITSATHRNLGGSSNIVIAGDTDGDLHAERSIWQKVDNSEASSVVSADVDEDGIPDVGNEVSAKVTRSILKSYFERGDKPTSSQFRVVADSSGVSSTCEVDTDNDDLPDGGCAAKSEQDRSQLKTYFETGDIPTQENRVVQTTDADGSSSSTVCQSVSSLSQMESSATPSSVVMELSKANTTPFMPGGDYHPATRVLAVSRDDSSKISLSHFDYSTGTNVQDALVELYTASESMPGGMVSSSNFRMGRPAINTATIQVTDAAATMTIDHQATSSADKPSSVQFGTLIDSYVHMTEDGVTRCAMGSSSGLQLRDQFGNERSSVSTEGTAYLSDRIGIGKVPTEKIDVAGGAYCDGTNWVNASDRNAKENFEKVDGEELLDKISELDITKWNYKCDKSTEHIGPTAQDFKETFGVGSDGKSISTIDPSGIALAAIKELYAQLKSRDKQLAELEKRDKERSADVQRRDAQLAELEKELKQLREELKKKQ